MPRKKTPFIMVGFIGLVIIAGLFGPYGISVVLGALSAACLTAI